MVDAHDTAEHRRADNGASDLRCGMQPRNLRAMLADAARGRITRGFSTLEVAIGMSIFLALAVAVVMVSLQTSNVMVRSVLLREVAGATETSLNQLASSEYSTLLSGTYTAPNACADNQQQSCVQLRGQTYRVAYDISPANDPVHGPGASARYLDVQATTTFPDGTTVVRQSRIPAPSVGYAPGTAVVRTYVVTREGDVDPTTLPPVRVRAADGTSVSDPAAFNAAGVATVRVDITDDPCTSGNPCRLALSETDEWWTAEDDRDQSWTLSPMDVLSDTQQLVLSDGAVADVAVEMYRPGVAEIAVQAQSDSGSTSGQPPANSVCVFGSFDDGVEFRTETFCNNDGGTIAVDTYQPDSDNPNLRLPVPPNTPVTIGVNNPDGSATCPQDDGMQGFSANASGFVPAAVCTSWTWGIPDQFGPEGDLSTFEDNVSTLTAQANQTTNYVLTFAGDDARPAAGYSGEAGPLWGKPRVVEACNGPCYVEAEAGPPEDSRCSEAAELCLSSNAAPVVTSPDNPPTFEIPACAACAPNGATAMLEFDGEDDQVQIPNDAVLNQTSYTVQFWLRPDAGPTGSWRPFFVKGDGDYTPTNRAPGMWLYPNDMGFIARHENPSDGQEGAGYTTGGLPLGEWSHIAVTMQENGRQKIYVDGAVVSDVPVGDLRTNNMPLYLMNSPIHLGVDGSMADVRMYNHARSGTEIADELGNGTVDQDGLVGWWPMDDGSGTTVTDQINGNDGTITGAQWSSSACASCPPNGATDYLQFDGTNDYVALNSRAQSNSIGQVTLEAWVKTDVTGETWSSNWSIIDYDAGDYFNMFVAGNTGQVGFATRPNNASFHYGYTNTTVNDGQWHHIAAVYDGTDKILYVDGVEDNRYSNVHGGAALGTGNARYGYIGDGSQDGVYDGARNGLHYEGAISDVRYWTTARTAAEIANNRFTIPNTVEPGLQGAWPLDDGEGPTARDVTGGNNGAVNGARWTSSQQPQLNIEVTDFDDDPVNATVASVPTRGTLAYCPACPPNGADAAMALDGSSDYVPVNHAYTTAGALPQMTAEGWVRTDASGGNYNSNWSILDYDRSEYFNLYVREDDGTVGFSTTDNVGVIHDMAGNQVVNDGQWHHIAAVYDGQDKVIYVDGVEDARVRNPHSGNPLGSGATRYGIIGDGSESTSYNAGRNALYFDGELSDVRMWETARDPLDIAQDRFTLPSGTEPGLAAAWPMDDGSGNTVRDVVGSADGARAGGSWFLPPTTTVAAGDDLGAPQDSPASWNLRYIADSGSVGADFVDTFDITFDDGNTGGSNTRTFGIYDFGEGDTAWQLETDDVAVFQGDTATFDVHVTTADGRDATNQDITATTSDPNLTFTPTNTFTTNTDGVAQVAVTANNDAGTTFPTAGEYTVTVATASGATADATVTVHPAAGNLTLDTGGSQTATVPQGGATNLTATATDLAGDPFQGVIVGFNQPSGDPPTALTFNGNDDRVTVPNDPALNLTNYTVQFWVRPDQGPTGDWRQLLVKGDGSVPSRAPGIWLRPNSMGLHFGHQDTGTYQGYANSNTTLQVGQWTHVTLTVTNNGTATFYINGEPAGSSDMPALSTNTLPLYFMNRATDGRGTAGAMADVRIYDHVRSQTNINSDMAAREPEDTTGLVGWWPLTETAGAADQSGNGHDGTITGATFQYDPAAESAQPPLQIGDVTTAGSCVTDDNGQCTVTTQVRTSTPTDTYRISAASGSVAADQPVTITVTPTPARITADDDTGQPTADNNSTVEIRQGDTGRQFTVSMFDGAGAPIENGSLTYTYDTTRGLNITTPTASPATVPSSGQITFSMDAATSATPGTTNINLQIGSVTKTVTVDVSQAPAAASPVVAATTIIQGATRLVGIEVQDANGNPISGVPVEFSGPAGDITVSGGTTTAADGTAYAAVTADDDAAAGTYTVQAQVTATDGTGSLLLPTPVDLTVDVTTTNLSIETSGEVAQGRGGAMQFTVTDAAGQPASGVSLAVSGSAVNVNNPSQTADITFGPATTTNGSGTAVISLNNDTGSHTAAAVGTYRVNLTANGQPTSATFDVTPTAGQLLTSNAVVGQEEQRTVRVKVYDLQGRPAADVPVDVSSDTASLTTSGARTNDNGVAYVTVGAGTNPVGTYRVQLESGAQSTVATVAVTPRVGDVRIEGVPHQSTDPAGGAVINVPAGSTEQMTVWVYDRAGDPMAGAPVQLSHLPDNGVTAEQYARSTTSSGTVTFTLRAADNGGDTHVRATAGQAQTAAAVTVTN